jgi:hypothetical protein
VRHSVGRRGGGQHQEQACRDHDGVVAARSRFDHLEGAHDDQQGGTGRQAVERAKTGGHGQHQQRGDGAQQEAQTRRGFARARRPLATRTRQHSRPSQRHAPRRRAARQQHAGAEHQRGGNASAILLTMVHHRCEARGP